MKKTDYSRYAFGLSFCVFLFLYGVTVGQYRIFPYSALNFTKLSLREVVEDTGVLLRGKPTRFLAPARHPGSGVSRITSEATPGLTLIAGFFKDTNEIRLVRLDGSVVQRWPVSFYKLFPDRNHILPRERAPNSDWNAEIHGALAMPDGSIVFNFDYAGTVELDRCAAVRWTVPRMTHHSLERSEDGGFWVPGRRFVADVSRFPPVSAPYYEDTILKLSSQGEVLKEISVPKLFFDDKNILSVFMAYLHLSLEIPDLELVHLNDIEELGSQLADRFPEFSAGDLAISLRERNLIMVVDPQSEKVKWHKTGPWIRQHDPDFTDDGKISVFNNNADYSETGSTFGGSNIVVVDPASGNVSFVYGTKPGQHFYTFGMGKHQILPRGHILITEYSTGRIFEVNENGETVWEFINRYSDTEISHLTSATRYPEDYFNVTDWTCSPASK